jgi:hypothetical protein
MKIAFVTAYDLNNITNWSGIAWYMAKSLRQQSLSLEVIGPLKDNYSRIFKEKQFLYKHFLKLNYLRVKNTTYFYGLC